MAVGLVRDRRHGVRVVLHGRERRRERRPTGRCRVAPSASPARPPSCRLNRVVDADLRARSRVVAEVRHVDRDPRRASGRHRQRLAVGQPRERAERVVRRLVRAARDLEAALPRVAGRVAERRTRRTSARSDRSSRSSAPASAYAACFAVVTPFGSPGFVSWPYSVIQIGTVAMERRLQLLLEERQRRQRHVRVAHLLQRRQVRRRRDTDDAPTRRT